MHSDRYPRRSFKPGRKDATCRPVPSPAAPLPGQRILIWAHTAEGHEGDPHSNGATLTDEIGEFRREMPQIVPAFGQPQGHVAYDSGEFETVFLRPVMPSASDTSLETHFVMQLA